MAECPRETCWPEVGCSLGHLDLSKCPALEVDPTLNLEGGPWPEGVAVPWSGGLLGLTDLGFVAGRRKPVVLAVVGPEGAGKTTLLGAWYLLLGRGFRPDAKLQFAGSCSIAGWEVLGSSLRWEPGSIPPTFPPHTSSSSARIPGLLHLGFQQHRDDRRDYVMTDAPGEWFRKWALNREAPDAEGARWAAEHADAFLLIADRAALAGSEKGAARTGIRLLARRLADELRGRPVAFVWTKSDIPIPMETEEAVRSTVRRMLPKAAEFTVSIMPGSDGTENVQEFLGLLRWALNVNRPTVRFPRPAGRSLDPVLAVGVS